MADLPLAFTGLLGIAYIVCSLVEFILRLLEREPSSNRYSRRTQLVCQVAQEGREWNTPLENPEPIIQPSSPIDLVHKPGILIVDDHILYRKILERWFREHGFTVWVAANGLEAVQIHQAHVLDISLALLDVHMPGLGGPETLVALRQETSSLPCCFMTRNLPAKQESQLLALGAAHIFEKPLLLHEATIIICSLIHKTSNKLPASEYAPGE